MLHFVPHSSDKQLLTTMTLKTGVTEVADSEEEFMTSSPVTNLDGVHEHLPQLASGTADSEMPTTSDESMIIDETTPINDNGTISLPANEQSNTIINDMNTSVSNLNHSSGAISSTADIARVEGGDLPEPISLQTETGIREELDTVDHIDPVTNIGGTPLTKSPNVTKQQTTRPSPTPSDQSTALEQVVSSGNDDVVDREGSFDTHAPSVSHHKSSGKETTGAESRIQPELTEGVLSDTKHSELVSDTHDLSELSEFRTIPLAPLNILTDIMKNKLRFQFMGETFFVQYVYAYLPNQLESANQFSNLRLCQDWRGLPSMRWNNLGASQQQPHVRRMTRI
jgi:hypothetical protein